MAAVSLATSDHWGPYSTHVRYRGPVDEALPRRLPISRHASWRPQLRHLPRQRVRVGEPAPGAVLPHGPHTRSAGAAGGAGESRAPVHPGPAEQLRLGEALEIAI